MVNPPAHSPVFSPCSSSVHWQSMRVGKAKKSFSFVFYFCRYEQMFLGAQLGLEINMDTIWIGLSQGDDGVYAWVDGTTDVTFTNWGEDYPGMILRWGVGWGRMSGVGCIR